jgi:predicted outer membrane repeat protein
VKFRRFAIFGVAAAFLVPVSAVFAMDRLVPSVYPTIQAGIDAAVDGDTVVVDPNTYYENINFGGKSITVISSDPNDPAAAIIDAGGSGTVVTFPDAADANCVLAGFTITDGGRSFGGGIHCRQGTITINNCVITGNSAEAGGGILNDHAELTVGGCTFNQNVATTGNGGGIYSIWGELTLTDCTFNSNSASDEGGGVATDYKRVAVTNCTFSGNSAHWGGGMNNSHWGATATNCVFIGNSAEKGAAICTKQLRYGDLTLRLSNCTFSGNVANSYGGAVCNRWGGSLALTDCIAWGNIANEGPQIAFEGSGTVSVSHSCLQGGDWNVYPPEAMLNWPNGSIEDDPCFVTGPVGDYYLSQIAAGQGSDSPCVDARSDWAANLGVDMYTTRTDEISDVGIVDIGYHYAGGTLLGQPDINLDLHVDSFDYCILAANWRQCNEPCDANWLPGDIIKNHCVDANDLKALVFSWLDCYVGAASTPTPPDNTTGADPNLMLVWNSGYGSLSHDVYLGTDANAVGNAEHLSPEFMGPVSEASFDPGGLEFGTEYYWRIDEAGPRCTQLGAVWSFTADDGKASDPDPANGRTLVPPDKILSWTPGLHASLHDLYFGTDYNDVNDADTTDASVYKGEQIDSVWDPCGLEYDSSYYWRIDEKSSFGAVKGDVWGFTTGGEPNSHLVGWWKFDEGTAGTAYDSAGTNHGTVYGPNWTSGQINGALSFDGTDDYVEVADAPSLRFGQYDSFSMSFWARPLSSGYVLSKMRTSNCSSGIFGYQANWTASKFHLVIEKSCVQSVAVGTLEGAAPPESWYHVTCVYDNKDMAIYMNGQLHNSGTFNHNTGGTTPDKNLAIGARSYDSTITSHFGGVIDDVRIYNRALSEQEIQQLYQP